MLKSKIRFVAMVTCISLHPKPSSHYGSSWVLENSVLVNTSLCNDVSSQNCFISN